MNRTRIACFCLIASACVLAGLLVVSLQNRLPGAEAALVVTRDNYTIMTAKTKGDEEALFVVDSLNERLLIYTVNLQGVGGRLDLSHSEDLARMFATGGATPGKGGGGRAAP